MSGTHYFEEILKQDFHIKVSPRFIINMYVDGNLEGEMCSNYKAKFPYHFLLYIFLLIKIEGNKWTVDRGPQYIAVPPQNCSSYIVDRGPKTTSFWLMKTDGWIRATHFLFIYTALSFHIYCTFFSTQLQLPFNTTAVTFWYNYSFIR